MTATLSPSSAASPAGMASLPPLSLSRGEPWPLGASVVDGNANFALFSSVASRVELCLYVPDSKVELGRIDLPCCSDGVWHVAIGGLPLPIAYGYRVHGPADGAGRADAAPRHAGLADGAPGLVGGFATPMLIAAGEPVAWAVFGFLAVLTACLAAIRNLPRWRSALIPAPDAQLDWLLREALEQLDRAMDACINERWDSSALAIGEFGHTMEQAATRLHALAP